MTVGRAIVWGGLGVFPGVLVGMFLWWMSGGQSGVSDWRADVFCSGLPLAIMALLAWRGWRSDPDLGLER